MRVVSLLPAATDIVIALGGADLLVGITHECTDGAVAGRRERVTACAVDATAAPDEIDAQVRTLALQSRALYAFDEERIRQLRPDLILTQALCDVCAVKESEVRALAARLSPAPAVVSLSGTTLEDVFDDIARVGAAIGFAADAAALVAGLRSRLRSVHATLKAECAPRPRVAVIEWTDPVFTAGHWVPAMIARAGGVDVLAPDGGHSRVISLEAVAASNPHLVLVAPCGFGLDRAVAEARRLLGAPEWGFLRACAVWALDANTLTSRPGPQLVNGIEVMARIFNPALFAPLDASHAMRVHLGGASPHAT